MLHNSFVPVDRRRNGIKFVVMLDDREMLYASAAPSYRQANTRGVFLIEIHAVRHFSGESFDQAARLNFHYSRYFVYACFKQRDHRAVLHYPWRKEVYRWFILSYICSQIYFTNLKNYSEIPSRRIPLHGNYPASDRDVIVIVVR